MRASSLISAMFGKDEAATMSLLVLENGQVICCDDIILQMNYLLLRLPHLNTRMPGRERAFTISIS